MANIPLSAQLLEVKSRSDRTYNLKFNTQELGGDDAAKLLNNIMAQVWLVIAPYEGDSNPITEKDIPQERPEFEGQKSQAQVMRSVLYRIWEQKGRPGKSFELYYKVRTEKLINQLKEELD